ncbi:hypothetical protein [Halalkalicoccus sp. NIPERK01]|uniref:DUF7512 family protein n=1 Tax=Halalkalicoccus sp. NIPERK01 TaxID=3053469 RepID=UPI00256EFE66|nr:hypothetical protein [Halalkalicoccus sp. NIPERK01]MDL5363148.1 hypothetical protein [Halalkalicoccus sp. NIPERK01]
MSDWDAEFSAGGCQSSIAWIVPLSILMIPLSVLLVAPVFSESGQAVATVGYVLAEALVLYVGYGALVRIASPAAREILEST